MEVWVKEENGREARLIELNKTHGERNGWLIWGWVLMSWVTNRLRDQSNRSIHYSTYSSYIPLMHHLLIWSDSFVLFRYNGTEWKRERMKQKRNEIWAVRPRCEV